MMDWVAKLWKSIKGQETVDMMFVDLTSAASGQPTLEPNECYVELYVDSLRLRNARKFATTFHGVVYTFVNLPFEGDARIKIPAISKPQNLEQLDPAGLGNVITINKQMMGAIPWRGGPMLLELGLFSVKGGNLLTPVLDFVSEISTAAGVSFAGKIGPFAPLISKGMNMLAGQTRDVALEVGVDTALELSKPGTYAMIAAPKNGSISDAKLSLDQDRKLLHDGQPLKQAYCVFSVKRADQKVDFGEIPELKESFAKLRGKIREGQMEPAQEAFASFRLTAMTSPDLIRKDAKRLVALAKEMMDEAFGEGPVSRMEGEIGGPGTLADLPLYGS
jgi:hypothetical protein